MGYRQTPTIHLHLHLQRLFLVCHRMRFFAFFLALMAAATALPAVDDRQWSGYGSGDYYGSGDHYGSGVYYGSGDHYGSGVYYGSGDYYGSGVYYGSGDYYGSGGDYY